MRSSELEILEQSRPRARPAAKPKPVKSRSRDERIRQEVAREFRVFGARVFREERQ